MTSCCTSLVERLSSRDRRVQTVGVYRVAGNVGVECWLVPQTKRCSTKCGGGRRQPAEPAPWRRRTYDVTMREAPRQRHGLASSLLGCETSGEPRSDRELNSRLAVTDDRGEVRRAVLLRPRQELRWRRDRFPIHRCNEPNSLFVFRRRGSRRRPGSCEHRQTDTRNEPYPRLRGGARRGCWRELKPDEGRWDEIQWPTLTRAVAR